MDIRNPYCFRLCTILALFASIRSISSEDGPHLLCHVTNWAQYRPAPWKFSIDQVNASLCTHLIYSFANINDESKIQVTEPAYDLGVDGKPGSMKTMNALKEQNPKLKTLLAVGGWEPAIQVKRFSRMVASASLRQTFINSSINFLKDQNFDGIDICWLYPGMQSPPERSGSPEDKVNFMTLLKEMRIEFQKQNLLLVVSVSPMQFILDVAYNATELAENVDLIKVLTYDFHGSWENFTHHHSPLYAGFIDNELQHLYPDILSFNTNHSMTLWKNMTNAPGKLVFSLGTYGRGYSTADAIKFYSQIGVPALGPNPPGPYTRAPGFWSYFEVCEKFTTEPQWVPVDDSGLRSPFAFFQGGNTWISYEDAYSAEVKGLFAKENQLGGVAVWTLDMDDYQNVCKDGHFPIISGLRQGLGLDDPPSPNPTTTTAQLESTTTGESTTTSTESTSSTEATSEGGASSSPTTNGETTTAEATGPTNGESTSITTGSESKSSDRPSKAGNKMSEANSEITETTETTDRRSTTERSESTSSTSESTSTETQTEETTEVQTDTTTKESTTQKIQSTTTEKCCTSPQESESTTEVEESTTTTPRTTRGSTRRPSRACRRNGWNRDPDDCRNYYWCRYNSNSGRYRYKKYRCKQFQVYNPRKEACDDPSNVPGCEN